MPGDPERILLVRLSAIGDVIHALFGLAALRSARPRAFVGFLVEDRAASLVAGHPDLDRVHVYRRRDWQRGALRTPARTAEEAAAFLADLRGARYDTAVDLQGNLKGGLLAALSGARRRIGLGRGHGREANHLFQTERVEPPPGPLHRVDRVLALLAPLGVRGPAGTPRIARCAEDASAAEAFLSGAGLARGGFAVLHPGTSEFGRHKRWSPERFGDLARALLDRRGLRSVATWGPGEEDLALEVVRTSGGAALPGPGTRSLAALAELATASALLVAADTGALHLAALLGVPSVGLFGPKDPRVYAPRGARVAVVHRGVDCSPCPRRSCSDPVCMTSIAVEDVLRAVEEVVPEKAGAASASKNRR